MADDRFTLDEARRKLAVIANGEVWRLLGQKDRSEHENARMADAAHASLYLWSDVGTAANRQRGLWLISRVYAVLGNGESAMAYARRCHALTHERADEMEPFDRAYASEALARAHRVLGDDDAADALFQDAELLGREIPGEKDRETFLADLKA